MIYRYAALLAVFAAPSFAQCAATYADYSGNSDGTIIYAWSVLTDDYTASYTGCAPWGGGFVHSYSATAQITSPTGRVTYGYGSGSQYGGAGAGSNYANVQIATQDEDGVFFFQSNQEIDCSVAGPGFFWESVSIPINFGSNAITSYVLTDSSHVPWGYDKNCPPPAIRTCGDGYLGVPPYYPDGQTHALLGQNFRFVSRTGGGFVCAKKGSLQVEQTYLGCSQIP